MTIAAGKVMGTSQHSANCCSETRKGGKRCNHYSFDLKILLCQGKIMCAGDGTVNLLLASILIAWAMICYMDKEIFWNSSWGWIFGRFVEKHVQYIRRFIPSFTYKILSLAILAPCAFFEERGCWEIHTLKYSSM